MSFFDNVEWSRLGKAIEELWSAPGSNLGASLLFVAAVGIILLIFVTLGFSVVLSLLQEEDDEEDEYEDEEEGAASSPRPATSASSSGYAQEEERVERFPKWARGLVWVVFLVLALVVFDFVGGGTDVCRSCHEKPHARAKTDPHVAVACVKCHEDRHGVALFSSAAARGMHILSAAVRPSWSGGYGAVTARSCSKCHKKQVTQTFVVNAQQVRMSHKEPLEASANCIDCHVLNSDGEVGPKTRGMTPCLRCHDGKRAKNGCNECHLGDPSASIRADQREMVFTAGMLVPEYRCAGCHKDQTKCDNCHGLRMPHSQAFKDGEHAKAAAFEKKQTCIKVCHVPGRCNMCHEFHFEQRVSGHAPNWVVDHGRGRSMNSPCSCHAPKDDPTRPFCPLCHKQ